MSFSMGSYGVIFNLAIDVRYHDVYTEKRVAETIDKAIRDKFEDYRAGQHLVHILVEFKELSLNALNFLVRVDMDSGIDDDYYHVKRLANAACIEACNANGWRLPGNQIALHDHREEIPA